MKAALLHHLGAPCVATPRSVNNQPWNTHETLHFNPEVFVRLEPGGAVLTPPHLYASFLALDQEFTDLLPPNGRIDPYGLPQDMIKLLLENQVLLRVEPMDPKPRRSSTVLENGLPSQVLLDVTSVCNCRCVACYHETDLDGYTPPLDDVVQRIRLLVSLGVSLFEVTGGEPFLRPDLARILDEIAAHGAWYYVVTNGEFLADVDQDLIERLRRGLGVAVSLDGTGELHDQIRGRPGLFRRILAGLDRLRLEGIRIYLVSTLHQDNVHSTPDLIELAATYDTTIHLRQTIHTGGAVKNSIPRLDLRQSLQPYLNHPNVRNGLLGTKKSIPVARYYGCGIRKRISLDVRGRIFPCVMDRQAGGRMVTSTTPAGLVQSLAEEALDRLDRSPRCRACPKRLDRVNLFRGCGGFCRFSRSYQQERLP